MAKEKIYAVTCVSLSDEDYEENGFSSVKVCDTLDEAKEAFNEFKDNEIDELVRRNEPWEVLTNEETEFRMSWRGHGHQVRIQIHTLTKE